MQEIVKIARANGAHQELTVAFSSNTEMFDVHFYNLEKFGWQASRCEFYSLFVYSIFSPFPRTFFFLFD